MSDNTSQNVQSLKALLFQSQQSTNNVERSAAEDQMKQLSEQSPVSPFLTF